MAKPTLPLILDGGLATELETRGHRLHDRLWSARLLYDQPQEILAAHRAFVDVGADILTTASYQATIEGFWQFRGLSPQDAATLLRRSVCLARQAAESTDCQVAASIGPYGAFLANGAEYTGDYAIDEDKLLMFHRRRWQVLAAEQPDMMLCETIPSLREARVLAELASQTSGIPTWISFSCRNGSQICDGTPVEVAIGLLDPIDEVTAVGVNCTDPRFLPELIRRISGSTRKTLVVYPNSGESYDTRTKTWQGERSRPDLAAQACQWRTLGADVIGGCCRVTPEHIRLMRQALARQSPRANRADT